MTDSTVSRPACEEVSQCIPLHLLGTAETIRARGQHITQRLHDSARAALPLDERVWLDIQAVRRALIYVRDHGGPLPDANVTDVAVALHSPEVRQVCLTTVDSEWAITAARLWFKVVRRVPAPYTGDAAALLAYDAFLRGSLEFAQRAVDLVLPSARHHPLAAVIADALDSGTLTPPTEQALDPHSEPFLYLQSQLNQPAPPANARSRH